MTEKFTKVVEMLFVVALSSLAYYHFRFRDVILLKVGMSHLFAPCVVDLLSYLTPMVSLITALFLFFNKQAAIYVAEAIFFLYGAYAAYLYISTGSTCGCANVFIDIDLRQIFASSILFVLGLTIIVGKSKQRNNMLEAIQV
jgi:hypothetical protein